MSDPFYVAEAFHASGNSMNVYWRHGTLSATGIGSACHFDTFSQASAVCELLNECWPFYGDRKGAYYRAVQHAYVHSPTQGGEGKL